MAILRLFEFTTIPFLSAPDTADQCRKKLEQMLVFHKKVEIDFSNVYVTQGFLTHLFDPLVKEKGNKIFDRLFFANCTQATEFNLGQMIKAYNQQAISSE